MNGIASELYNWGPSKLKSELRLLQKKRENCEKKQKMCSNNSSIAENCTKDMDETFSEDWALICRKFILPPMTLFGMVFNVVSIIILLLERIKLRRSLSHLFAFLNFSDT